MNTFFLTPTGKFVTVLFLPFILLVGFVLIFIMMGLDIYDEWRMRRRPGGNNHAV